MVNIRAFLFNPNAIVLLGVIVVAIGIFWRARRSKTLVLIGALIIAVGAFWAQGQTRKLEIKIQAKDKEIKELNDYILSTITGGDSFCRLGLVSINSRNNRASLVAIPKGEYPLYDVSFKIFDVEEFEKTTSEQPAKPSLDFHVGNIAPGITQKTGDIYLGYGNEKRYNVFIFARNGFYTQWIRLKRIGGNWVMATKVTRGDKILYKNIDDRYPQDRFGNINWD
jgi:hypothetical protein